MLYKYSSAKQKGFTLLELLTVIGVMAVLATFVIPTIGNWRVETQIEKDYKALLGEIRYLQAKAKLVNGMIGGTYILFLHNGKATSASVEVFKPLGVSKIRDANYTAYKVTISSATGYIQLFRSKKGSDTWVELR